MDVTSSDGTTIHAEEAGEGPPILFVPGSTLDASAVAGVSAILAPRFRCVAMDRRGRGKSGDAPSHSLAQEVDDVLSLARAIGGPLTLFGHSYGGLCVLKAASRCPELASLILYEPPIDNPIAPETLKMMRAALDAGAPREALLVAMERVVQIRPAELSFVKTLPDEWFETRAATMVREMESVYAFDPERDLRLPDDLTVSVLLGSESTDAMRRNAERLLRDLPRSVLHTLEGQAHNALLFAPDLIARATDEHMQRLRTARCS